MDQITNLRELRELIQNCRERRERLAQDLTTLDELSRSTGITTAQRGALMTARSQIRGAISEEEQTIRRVRQQAWRVHGLEVAA